MVSDKCNVVTATPEMLAVDAFRMMDQKDVTSVPVVDPNNEVLATLSASDLVGLKSHQLPQVLLPINKFLEARKGTFENTAVCCYGSHTLHHVMALMAARGVHRVWVVEQDTTKLRGVITMTDVIRQFFQRKQG